MRSMRTTVTLDPDTAALVVRAMRERGLTFKQAVNEAIRAGLGVPRGRAVRTPTYRMGPATVPIDKSLQLAGQLEDEELVRRLAARK